jgi:hypothetical protein
MMSTRDILAGYKKPPVVTTAKKKLANREKDWSLAGYNNKAPVTRTCNGSNCRPQSDVQKEQFNEAAEDKCDSDQELNEVDEEAEEEEDDDVALTEAEDEVEEDAKPTATQVVVEADMLLETLGKFSRCTECYHQH